MIAHLFPTVSHPPQEQLLSDDFYDWKKQFYFLSDTYVAIDFGRQSLFERLTGFGDPKEEGLFGLFGGWRLGGVQVGESPNGGHNPFG
jgi:hypothetical protein